MPNHVANLLKFDTTLEPLTDKKVIIKNINVIAAKVGMLAYLQEGFLSSKIGLSILETIGYDSASRVVDALCLDFLQNNNKEKITSLLSVIAKPKNMIECFSGFRFEDEDDLVEFLKTPTPDSEVSFFDSKVFFPQPIKFFVNGFNGSFDKWFANEATGFIGCDSGYHNNINAMGTKCGIYETFIDDNELFFNTAWDPLDEEAMLKLIRHIENASGGKFESFICAEQRMCYWAEGSIDNLGDFVYSDTMDLPFTFVDEDDESTLEECLKSGYEEIFYGYFADPDLVSPNLSYLGENYGLGG